MDGSGFGRLAAMQQAGSGEQSSPSLVAASSVLRPCRRCHAALFVFGGGITRAPAYSASSVPQPVAHSAQAAVLGSMG